MQQLLPGPIRRFIHAQSDELDVQRQPDGSDNLYGTSADYESVGSRIVAFGGIQESMQPTAAGEIQSQRLVMYSLPDEDIQVDDRLTHGDAGTVEVVAKFDLPNEQNPAVTRYELEDA